MNKGVWYFLLAGIVLGVLLTLAGGKGGTTTVARAQSSIQAIDVAFDNLNCDLSANNVQVALEELDGKQCAVSALHGQEALATTSSTLTGAINELVARLNAADSATSALESKTTSMSISGDNLYFNGLNVHIRNGAGSSTTVNGLGNLIIGYDEDIGNDTKTGSHNLVVGAGHTYTNYCGLVVGHDNTITGQYASVSGGANCTASGNYSSVCGGQYNEASGLLSTVSGGYSNKAQHLGSTVSGGRDYVTSADDQHLPN